LEVAAVLRFLHTSRMRHLILSDIHANLEALQTVMEEAARDGFDNIICCGDIVGYGASPNEAIEWTRTNTHAIIRGNHDKASAGLSDLSWFNPVAQQSTRWTHRELTPENLAYLSNLEKGPKQIGSFSIFHGSPVDEDEYIVKPTEAGQISGYLETSVSFFGHTHIQGGFAFMGERVETIPPTDESGETVLELRPDYHYMINPGSVGQPRDCDPRTAWVVYEPERRTVTYRRAAYDVGGAQKRILEAGLPTLLAQRLAVGR
jgi:predicted phosphodiesterase